MENSNLMFTFVALFTKCNAIINIKSQLRIISKRFDVMRVQVPSFIVVAFLTSKFVPNEYIVAPLLVFITKTFTAPFNHFAIFIGIMLFTTRNISFAPAFAYKRPTLKRVRNTKSWLFAFIGDTKKQFRSLSMCVPFKGGDTPLVSPFHFYSNTIVAFGIKTVTTAHVFIEFIFWLPCFAFTTLFIINRQFDKFFNRNASYFCSRNSCSLFSLSRPSNIIKMVPSSWITYPPRNIIYMTSCPDQESLDTLLPQLLEVPGKHGLSLEPLIGRVDICAAVRIYQHKKYGSFHTTFFGDVLHWVIVGGESGFDARPILFKWINGVMEQCKTANVPYFLKQDSQANTKDFKTIDHFPVHMQVRQFPEYEYDRSNV